jgi:methyl-accepting chemotaxis protein
LSTKGLQLSQTASKIVTNKNKIAKHKNGIANFVRKIGELVRIVADYGRKIQEITGVINTCKTNIQKLGQQGKEIEGAIKQIKK